MPEGITAAALDREVRRELRGLPRESAERVGAHLAAAQALRDDDPEAAYAHAAAAARRAGRLAVVREAAGLAAYATGRWAEAKRELLAARRMSGHDDLLPLIADCERGLGRPERALALASAPEVARLDRAVRVEMLIVAAGARRDLGQADAAVVELQVPELRASTRGAWQVRLRYAYADALLDVGRRADAAQWFARVAAADGERRTDAADRLAELRGEQATPTAAQGAILDLAEPDAEPGDDAS